MVIAGQGWNRFCNIFGIYLCSYISEKVTRITLIWTVAVIDSFFPDRLP